MLWLFVSAFALGAVFNATPGAVFAETVRQGVRGGFAPALAVQLGSLVGDAAWAVLGLAGVGLLLQLDVLRLPLGLAGAGYLAWLARDAWKAARTEHRLDVGTAAAPRREALRKGALLSLTNPQNLAYWAAAGSAMGALGIHEPRVADFGIFLAGFMSASLLWCFLCATLVDRVFRRAGARWARFTYRLVATALLAFALASLRELWRTPAPERVPAARAALISQP